MSYRPIPIEITPKRQQNQVIQLQRSARKITFFFLAASMLPVILYLLFSYGIFDSRQSSAINNWEKATALVSTTTGLGTGFLVSSTKLLTARHVVEGLAIGDEVNITFDRNEPPITLNARLEWRDDTNYGQDQDLDYFTTDVAVLRLTEPILVEGIIPLEIGISEGVPTLTKVIAIGYPNGDFSITEGEINNETFEERQLFKLDAAINSGNSGGPLIDKNDGTVIGMLVGQRGGVVQGENVANKIDNIMRLLEGNGIILEE